MILCKSNSFYFVSHLFNIALSFVEKKKEKENSLSLFFEIIKNPFDSLNNTMYRELVLSVTMKL